MPNELTVIERNEGIEAFRMSTDAASLCKGIVLASSQMIQGKKYIKAAGWLAIALAHGCVASARNVERTETGFRAIGEVRKMSDGMVISQAEGFVGDDESTWASRPEFARRAMAQTRAISRACRSAFAHVVVMMNAGLSTTPAEEVTIEGFEPCLDKGQASKPPIQPSQERKETTGTNATPHPADEIITGISKISHKIGKGPGRIFDSAGSAYNTFSDSNLAMAKEAQDAGINVKIEFKKSTYGFDITALTKIEGEGAAERQPGDD